MLAALTISVTALSGCSTDIPSVIVNGETVVTSSEMDAYVADFADQKLTAQRDDLAMLQVLWHFGEPMLARYPQAAAITPDQARANLESVLPGYEISEGMVELRRRELVIQALGQDKAAAEEISKAVAGADIQINPRDGRWSEEVEAIRSELLYGWQDLTESGSGLELAPRP